MASVIGSCSNVWPSIIHLELTVSKHFSLFSCTRETTVFREASKNLLYE